MTVPGPANGAHRMLSLTRASLSAQSVITAAAGVPATVTCRASSSRRAGDAQAGPGGGVERDGLDPRRAVSRADVAGDDRGAEQRAAVQLGRSADDHSRGEAREVESRPGSRQ